MTTEDQPENLSEATAALLSAHQRGDREAMERYAALQKQFAGDETAEPSDAPEGYVPPMLDRAAPEVVAGIAGGLINVGARRILDEWGGEGSPGVVEAISHVREAVSHIEAISPELVEFLNEPLEGGKSAADDPDFVFGAAEFGRALATRDEGEWDANAEPPALPFTEDPARVLTQFGGEGLVRDLGGAGSETLARNMRYAKAAVDHLAKTTSGKRLLAKLGRPDPQNPGFDLGDRPAIIRQAVEFGRLLTHGRRAERPSTRSSTRTNAMQNSKPQGDVDDLIRDKLNALARGDQIKVAKLEKQIAAHFAKHADEPIVGTGGRYA